MTLQFTYLIYASMMNCDDDEWRPVAGFETHYEVSRSGLVRRIKPGGCSRPGRMIKRHISDIKGKDYYYYALSVDSKTHNVRLHRMMYETFVGPIPKGMHINHKNGIKTDNRIENLEVVTPSENCRHGYEVLGRKPTRYMGHKGENHPRALLSDAQALEVYELWKQRVPHKEIQQRYNITASTLQYTVYVRCSKGWRSKK